MAKYLQDIYIHSPQPPFTTSKAEVEKFYSENNYLWSSLKLIEDLYNYNFPVKYSTPDNLWRLFINITTDPNLDLTNPGFENWFYIDIEELKNLEISNRKKLLFSKVSNQIIAYCRKLGYSYIEFENLNKLITDRNIEFDEPYKKDKASPNRKYKAFIWIKYNEFGNSTYIKILNKAGENILFKKIADLHFSQFEKIHWEDNETVFLYKINQYNGFKQADDYYKINLNGLIEFVPQTKEEICYYGIELMRDIETFEKGLHFIKVAEKMNHGKAKNILLNLSINPNERNVDLLLQQPSKGKQSKR
jgi:hypothetical protein